MASLSQESQSNDTTDVTILSAPGSSTTRMVPVKGIKIYNNDTAAATVTLQKKLTGPADRIIEKFTLQPAETYVNDWVVNLDDTTTTLEIFLAAAVTTNQLNIDVSYRDESQ